MYIHEDIPFDAECPPKRTITLKRYKGTANSFRTQQIQLIQLAITLDLEMPLNKETLQIYIKWGRITL